jgi:hypothetical protein
MSIRVVRILKLIVTEQQGPVPNLVVQMHGGRLTSDNYPLSKTYAFILVLYLAVCMRGTIDTIIEGGGSYVNSSSQNFEWLSLRITLGTRLTFLYIFPYFVDYPNDHLLQYENVFDG